MATATANTKSRKSAKAGGARATAGADSATSAGADQLLKADHRNVEKLFKQYEQTTEPGKKQELAKSICTELMVHSELEESHFYPACREKNVESSLLDEAQVEHDVAKILIAEIMTLLPESTAYDAKIKVLSEYVKHHVGEEESSGSGIIAKARKAGVDMKALGEILVAQKQELMAKAQAGDLPLPTPRSLEAGTNSLNSNLQENQAMAQRGNQDRERDEQGRFMSEDDDRRYSRGGGSGGGGYGRGWDEQDRGGGRGRSSQQQDRDEQGRFVSEDERGGQRSGRGWYDDDNDRGRGRFSQQQDRDEYGRFRSEDDDRGGRGRFSSQRDRDQYGQFQRNDDDYRGGGRSSQERERDERGRFASDDDDNRGGRGRSSSQQRDRDEYGRFMSEDDDRGGRGSSGRGRDDDDDRGGRSSRGGGEDHRGWFGDPRGHAEAARRGWEHREDHNESRQSRGGDDNRRGGNDDNRRGGGGGDQRRSGGGGGDNRRSSGGGEDHGGWFGDSRGHSEAARRGWQHRNDR